MERIIKKATIDAAVKSAYEKFKDYKVDGSALDPRVDPVVAGKFGVSVRLTDGTVYNYGDTDTLFPMGTLLRIPVAIQALTQMSAMDFTKSMNSGKCPAGCNGSTDSHDKKPKGVHAKNLRMVSLLQPQGDADGKMQLLTDLMASLMGKSPVLETRLYEKTMKENIDKGVENTLAAAGYELYDSTPVALEVATRLDSMLVTAEQMSRMGAVIAADGVDPETNVPVFDGKISQTVVGMMAAKGPKHVSKPWLMASGMPAMSSFGGGVLAVMPGFGSIAVFAPELVDRTPFKAAMTVKEIASALDLNVFASARVKAE